MDFTPYTERRNAITTTIDAGTPEGIVELLHQCNLEVFDGYEQYKGLSDDDCLKKLDRLVPLVKDIHQNDKGIVVISGCGTSGRIGFLACTYFNELCRKQNLPEKYQYIIAGGNSALVTSVEACEDDPVYGAAELQRVSNSYERVLFIGITCGLSAPFVGGQLEYCLDHLDKFTPVLMGFNPISMARRLQVPKWPNKRTFHDVASRMEATPEAIVLNPIIGPEPISGSSRMKGGTATKVMLDIVFALASTNQTRNASEIVHELRTAVDRMINTKNHLGAIVQEAGQCLIRNGQIRYVGGSTFGIWGMIDASECVPTYNSDYDDIRGYMSDDYFRTNLNIEPAGTIIAPALQESTPDDLATTMSNLKPSSFVIFVDPVSCQAKLIEQLRSRGHRIGTINLFQTNTGVNLDKSVDLSDCTQIPSDMTLRHCFAETVLKLAMNTISTGAHVMKGKVYQNIMIDVRVSNIKLFYRAVDIIKSLAHVDQQVAERCLVQSIYQSNTTVDNQSVEQHIAAVANNRNHVVPIALLMALSNSTYDQAKLDIEKCPRIRDICIERVSSQK